jgi:CYTH domain-containing protein
MKGIIGTGRVGQTHSEKYARGEFERRFLLRELPEGLTVAHPHTQITDNYITGTRLRLRKVREPRANEWTLKLTQKFAPDPSDFSRTLVTNIYLTEYEYEVLSVFEANELRKNRYPFMYGGRRFTVDVFLGDLLGLLLAETEFEAEAEMRALEAPPFAAREVTGEEMFTGARLVELTAADLRRELARRDGDGDEKS